jgi:hypothetical protein
MLSNADVERFLGELAEVCARHGVTVIGSFDGCVSAIMRGQPIDLTNGTLDNLIDQAIREKDPGDASPETFF